MRRWVIIGMEQPSDDTPSVSPSGCQLPQGGSREGCVPFDVPLKNRNVAGDFHRPYENSESFTFYHSTGYSRNRKGTGDFHRPYETQNI